MVPDGGDVDEMWAQPADGGDPQVDDSVLDAIVEEISARDRDKHGGMDEAARNAANRAYNQLIGKKCTRGTKHRAGKRENRKRAANELAARGNGARGSGSRLVNQQSVRDIVASI